MLRTLIYYSTLASSTQITLFLEIIFRALVVDSLLLFCFLIPKKSMYLAFLKFGGISVLPSQLCVPNNLFPWFLNDISPEAMKLLLLLEEEGLLDAEKEAWGAHWSFLNLAEDRTLLNFRSSWKQVQPANLSSDSARIQLLDLQLCIRKSQFVVRSKQQQKWCSLFLSQQDKEINAN
jgi:hypothetical protein